MSKKFVRVLTIALFVGGLLACTTSPVEANDDPLLNQLLKDRNYGKLNKFIADEVGSSLSAQKLGMKIHILNNLAKEAEMSEDKVLDLFKDDLKDGKRKGLHSLFALEAITQSIAFALALRPEPDTITNSIGMKLKRPSAAMSRPSSSDTITNSIGMKLTLIPAGEFLMGSPADEADRSEDEGPQHTVRITKPFYMGVTEVTQGQWFEVMGTKPWAGKEYVQEGDNYPAVYVSWEDAVEYCRKLIAKDGNSYRLPTEAEWEYACRGGTTTAYSFGSSSGQLKDYCWFEENAYSIREKYAHHVRMKQPNAFGLFDMHGNVWEWCDDVYDAKAYSSRSGTTSDPMSKSGSEYRVARSGSCGALSGSTRSAYRLRNQPVDRGSSFGFRVVRLPSVAGKDVVTNSIGMELKPPTSGKDMITNSIGMKLTLIPAGEFLMGSPADEAHRRDAEGPQHKIRITKSFYIGVTEVTQGQWLAVMRTKPWAGKQDVQEGDNYPAVYVSWEDAVEYCEKLSTEDGRAYRLPTEAQWEYACRGGTNTAWSFGSSSGQLKDYGWFGENVWNIGEKYAHHVRMKQPNAFGLFDMHGNVGEWCDDVYDAKAYSSRSGTTSDPMSKSGSEYRVSRGGSWSLDSGHSRSAYRGGNRPDYRYYSTGFRVVR